MFERKLPWTMSPAVIPCVMITRGPRAILLDLFHTLVTVPPPGGEMGLSIAEALGMPERHAEVARRYYEDDVLDRCRGRVGRRASAAARRARLDWRGARVSGEIIWLTGALGALGDQASGTRAQAPNVTNL